MLFLVKKKWSFPSLKGEGNTLTSLLENGYYNQAN